MIIIWAIMQLYAYSVQFMNSKDTSLAFLASMGIADPQKKPVTLPPQLEKEFAQASEYFKTHPDVFKLGRTNKEKFKQRYSAQTPIPDIEHSFFNFNGRIVCTLPQKQGDIGSGQYGKGTLAMDEYGHVFLMKIENKALLQQQAFQKIFAGESLRIVYDQEIAIGKDVGLIVASGEKVVEGIIDDKLGDVREYTALQSYILMEFKGDSVKKKIQTSNLSEEQMLDFSIQAAWQCHLLHQGYLSSSGVPYVHGDLKPDQLVINAHKELSLIDFGNARTGLSEIHRNDSGSFDYLSSFCKNYTRQQVDTFALLRTIYMPDEFTDRMGMPKNRPPEIVSILNKKCIENNGLIEWFDTAEGKLPKDSSPAQIAFLLILTKHHCQDLFKPFKENQDAIAALNIVYQSGCIIPDEHFIKALLHDDNTIQCLAKLRPIMHLLDKEAQAKIVGEVLNGKLNLNHLEGHPLSTFLQLDSPTRHLIAPVVSKGVHHDNLDQVLGNLDLVKAISPIVRDNPKAIHFNPGEDITHRLCQEYKEEICKNLSVFLEVKKSLGKEEFRQIFNAQDVMNALKNEVQEHSNKYTKKGWGFFGPKNNDGINKLNQVVSSDANTYGKFTRKIEGISPDGALPFFRSRDPEIQKFYCIAHVLLSSVGQIQENSLITDKENNFSKI